MAMHTHKGGQTWRSWRKRALAGHANKPEPAKGLSDAQAASSKEGLFKAYNKSGLGGRPASPPSRSSNVGKRVK